ncbi:MAG: SRPBCC domain-containing protein [Archangium sp.]
MKSFHVSKHIPAAPERVWAVLTNPSKLASGALGITKLEGDIALGRSLKLWTEATGTRAFGLTVTTMEAPRTMVWEGGMPLGLFRGVRTFKLSPKDGGVQFEMTEAFSGLMAGLITKSIPDLTPSFERFANGLSALAQENA